MQKIVKKQKSINHCREILRVVHFRTGGTLKSSRVLISIVVLRSVHDLVKSYSVLLKVLTLSVFELLDSRGAVM